MTRAATAMLRYLQAVIKARQIVAEMPWLAVLSMAKLDNAIKRVVRRGRANHGRNAGESVRDRVPGARG